MALVGVMMASCACGKTEATTEATTEAKKATVEDATKATTTEAKKTAEKEKKTASETEATEVDENADSTDDTYKVENAEFAGASNASSAEVQEFLKGVIDDIKNNSWDNLGDKIYYPINIGTNEVADKDEFVALMEKSTVSMGFLEDVEQGDITALGSNGAGIMAFNGTIWLHDEGYDPVHFTGSPDLKVKSLNGIIVE